MQQFKAVVIGTSTGGLNALSRVLAPLPESFPLPVMIVQHISPDSDDFLVHHLNKNCNLRIKEADDKDKLEKGWVYLAPPNYHLLVEEEGYLSLAVTPPVNYSRPAIDVLFETAADAFPNSLIGIILTGANSDGTLGAKRIKNRGGIVIAQDPSGAAAATMPGSVIEKGYADYILPLEQIGEYLNNLITGNRRENSAGERR